MEPCKDVRIHCSGAYMEHVRGLTLRIEAMREEVERQRALLGPCSAQVRERVRGTCDTDGFEKGAIRLQELVADYCTEIAGYVEEYRAAHRAVSALPGAQAAALTGHYLHGKPWKRVALDMAYSERSVLAIRREALAALWDFLPLGWRRLPEAV